MPLSQLDLALFAEEGRSRPHADARGAALLLGERLVPYQLRRSRRRTIGLAIDHRGLRVGAPLRASLRDIENVIRQHSNWVLAKLDEWRQRPAPADTRLILRDGLELPYLGAPLTLRLEPLGAGRSRALWAADAASLTLCLPREGDPGPLLERALRERARECFGQRLAHYTDALGVPPPPLALSSARTRWGSCSLRSGIRLNWRLIHFPLPVLDYVVAHEVAHLKHMNHSPRFWSVVEQLYPEHAQARAELKRLGPQLPHW